MVSASGFVFAILSATSVAHAGSPTLPSGGTVVAGSASILPPDSAGTVIVQQSRNAVINWQSFSVGAGAGVTFRQPDSASITLNRVTGSQASAIDGSLLANGQVWMINRNGVLFGPGSHIDVGGLIATTSDMKDSDFLSGHYNFGTASANPDAAVVNQGSIKAATGGSVLLSAGRVKNEGLIQARLGHVVLGGADTFSVSFDGDNLLQYQITAPVSQTPKDSQGAPASSLVSNSGAISAQGGSVLMTARAARGVVDNVINTTGLIQASSASVQNGEVVLDAGEDGSVAVSGAIDVSGKNAGESGGTIAVRGNAIAVADDARLNASGDAGGGTILIGGNSQGGPAQSVAIGKSVIAADAAASGKGGTVTIASNGAAVVAASISAKGVAAGGMVETSGSELTVTSDAHVDTSASAGASGMWLLDPVNVVVDPALASNIVGNLASTNVTISASNDINVNAPVVYTSTNALSFLAGHNLTVNANVQNGGSGGILAVAGWDGVTSAASIFTTPGSYGGNGGSVLIGGVGANGGVALGSRNGATTLAAQNLTITASNGYAQLGYHGAPSNSIVTTGNISVVLGGRLTLAGGNTNNASFAQIGHGGHESIGNLTGDISISVQGPVSLAGGAALNASAQIGNGGTQSIGNNGGNVFLASGGDIALSTGARITAGGAGDALVLAAAGNFVNQAGSAALSVTGGGRWLVFLAGPANNVPGGLSASPYYNRSFNFATNSYAPVTGAGNRFVYGLAPMVTVTVASNTKIYGSANPALTATIAGGLPGDALAGVFTGAPVLSTTATAGSGVGNYAIVGSVGTLSSDFNYGFQFVNGVLRIDPATLTASLTGLVQKSYDGTSLAMLTAANYQLSGILPGDSVTLNNPATGSYNNKNVGSGKTVSVGGLTLSGPASGNYLLSSANASGAIGTITPVTVVASLVGTVQKIFDGTTAAILIPANYDLSGAIAGDDVALNNPAFGTYDSKYLGTGKTVSVSGLALSGSDSANYVLASPNANADIGIISATLITNAIGNSYTSGAAGTVSPGSAPAGGTGAQPVSDATSDTSAVGGDSVQTDSAAVQLGKSLAGAAQSSSSVLIDGLLRQFSAQPGSTNPRGVPPYGQVYSSWGNEAFWQ